MRRSRGIRGLCDKVRDVNSVPGSSIYIATAGFLLQLVALPILEASEVYRGAVSSCSADAHDHSLR